MEGERRGGEGKGEEKKEGKREEWRDFLLPQAHTAVAAYASIVYHTWSDGRTPCGHTVVYMPNKQSNNNLSNSIKFIVK